VAKGVPIYKLTQPDAPLRESAVVLLVRLQEMFDWSGAMRDPANVDDLHNMRIAAKRLRYTMELFAPCFGKDFARILGTIEEIQERIGAIHDCDVLIPLLEKTLDKEAGREKKQALRKGGGPPPFLAAEGLVPLIAAKRAERERLFREFVVFWDALPPEALFEQLTEIVQTVTAPRGK
jgi:CHAD domain-containing protein